MHAGDTGFNVFEAFLDLRLVLADVIAVVLVADEVEHDAEFVADFLRLGVKLDVVHQVDFGIELFRESLGLLYDLLLFTIERLQLFRGPCVFGYCVADRRPDNEPE